MNAEEDQNLPWTGEHALLLEMLCRALEDLSEEHDKTRREARRWLRERSYREFSARWICRELGIGYWLIERALTLPNTLSFAGIIREAFGIYRKCHCPTVQAIKRHRGKRR